MSLTPRPQESLRTNHHQQPLPLFIIVPGLVFGMVMLIADLPSPHVGWRIVWTVYIAFNFFCWMSCFHETVHLTLHPHRRFNIWLGRMFGTVFLIPYTVYREIHIRHHANMNKPSDWELWPYSDPNLSRGFRRMFVWFDLFLGFVTGPYIYGRVFFHRDSPIVSPKVRRAIRFEYAGIILTWGTAIGVLWYFGRGDELWKAWGLPLMLASIFLTMRKFIEHLGMASYDPLLGTRTVVAKSLWTRICSFLNFDTFAHGVHHRHPHLPHGRLEAKMNDYCAENPQQSFPVFASYRSAFLDMAPNLLRNPGVGVNAAAPEPVACVNAGTVETKRNARHQDDFTPQHGLQRR